MTRPERRGGALAARKTSPIPRHLLAGRQEERLLGGHPLSRASVEHLVGQGGTESMPFRWDPLAGGRVRAHNGCAIDVVGN
jgi:hypothetical protein